jgi:hypothetical protein
MLDMPKEERSWGVMFTSAGLSELRDEFQLYLEEGPLGQYLLCQDVDMSHQHLVRLRIIVDLQEPDNPVFELEYYVPYHYIKLIAAGGEEKVKKAMRFRGKNQ